MKTRDEVEKLKQNWLRDPGWDIEDTEGYEEFKKELRAYRLKFERLWAKKRQQHHLELAMKFCPMQFSGRSETCCYVELCAWWNKNKEQCAVMGLTQLETIAGRTGFSMQP